MMRTMHLLRENLRQEDERGHEEKESCEGPAWALCLIGSAIRDVEKTWEATSHSFVHADEAIDVRSVGTR